MSQTPPPPEPPQGSSPVPPAGPGPVAPPKNSGLAIASLVCGILGLVLCGSMILSILAVAFGAISRGQIRNSGGQLQGEGMALAGLILGIVGVVVGVIGLLTWVPALLDPNL